MYVAALFHSQTVTKRNLGKVVFAAIAIYRKVLTSHFLNMVKAIGYFNTIAAFLEILG